jgi:hypothetical protein
MKAMLGQLWYCPGHILWVLGKPGKTSVRIGSVLAEFESIQLRTQIAKLERFNQHYSYVILRGEQNVHSSK